MKIITKYPFFYLAGLLVGCSLVFVQCDCKPKTPTSSTVTDPNTAPTPPTRNSTITDPMIEAADKAGHSFLAQKLREIQSNVTGIDVNEKNPKQKNRTALHEAAQLGDIAIVKALFTNKATNNSDGAGDQPLDILAEQLVAQPLAKMANHLAMAQLLLAQGGQCKNTTNLPTLLEAFIEQGETASEGFGHLLTQVKKLPNSEAVITQTLKKSLNKGLSATALSNVLDQFPSDQVAIVKDLLNETLPHTPTEEANEATIKLLLDQVSEQEQVDILSQQLTRFLDQETKESTINSLLKPLSDEAKAQVLNKAFFHALNVDMKDLKLQTLTHLLHQIPKSKELDIQKGYLPYLLEKGIKDNNDKTIAKTILRSDVLPLNIPLTNDMPPAHLAASRANLDLLQFLVEEKKVDLFSLRDSGNDTALNSALYYYEIDHDPKYKPIIQYLVEKDPRLLLVPKWPSTGLTAINVENYYNILRNRRRGGIQRHTEDFSLEKTWIRAGIQKRVAEIVQKNMNLVQDDINDLDPSGSILDEGSKEQAESFLYKTLEKWVTNFDQSLDTTAENLLGISSLTPSEKDNYSDMIAFVRDAIQEAYEEELKKRLQ